MSTQRRKGGLGRGLEVLIPGEATAGSQEIEVGAIDPNPLQPRSTIDSATLTELVESIRQHGLLQPLLVTRRATGERGAPYILVAGERRWRAAQLAGLLTVPVIVREAAPQSLLELALVENLQRQDLNPLEEAEAYRHLAERFGLTQEQIAQRVGRSRVAVSNLIRLLALPLSIKEALAAGTLSEGHARALLALTDDAQRLAAFQLAKDRGLTVRQTEDMVRRWGREPQPTLPPSSAPARPDPDQRQVEDLLRTALGTRVELRRGPAGHGRLVIHFYSDEELDALYRLLINQR